MAELVLEWVLWVAVALAGLLAAAFVVGFVFPFLGVAFMAGLDAARRLTGIDR